MKRANARFLQKDLNRSQKPRRVAVTKEMLEIVAEDYIFIKRIITGARPRFINMSSKLSNKLLQTSLIKSAWKNGLIVGTLVLACTADNKDL